MDAEGIYRVSGAVRTVEQLSSEFDKGLPDANKYDPFEYNIFCFKISNLPMLIY